jgi:hypothetical protein
MHGVECASGNKSLKCRQLTAVITTNLLFRGFLNECVYHSLECFELFHTHFFASSSSRRLQHQQRPPPSPPSTAVMAMLASAPHQPSLTTAAIVCSGGFASTSMPSLSSPLLGLPASPEILLTPPEMKKGRGRGRE